MSEWIAVPVRFSADLRILKVEIEFDNLDCDGGATWGGSRMNIQCAVKSRAGEDVSGLFTLFTQRPWMRISLEQALDGDSRTQLLKLITKAAQLELESAP